MGAGASSEFESEVAKATTNQLGHAFAQLDDATKPKILKILADYPRQAELSLVVRNLAGEEHSLFGLTPESTIGWLRELAALKFSVSIHGVQLSLNGTLLLDDATELKNVYIADGADLLFVWDEVAAATAAVNHLRQELEFAAGPASDCMDSARKAAERLDYKDLKELEGFQDPPEGCMEVCAAIALLVKGAKEQVDWKYAQAMLSERRTLLEGMRDYKFAEIPESTLKELDQLLESKSFSYEFLKAKSCCAATFATWVINVVKCHKIIVVIVPMNEALLKATKVKEEAEAMLVDGNPP